MHRLLLLALGFCALLNACDSSAGDSDPSNPWIHGIPKSPPDPVAMRLAGSERALDEVDGSNQAAQDRRLVGDGRYRPIMSRSFERLDESYWPEERAARELIAGPLQILREVLSGASTDFGAVFKDTAKVASLDPIEYEVTDLGSGLTERRWTQASAPLPLLEWAAQLPSWREQFKRVRWSLLTPLFVHFKSGGAELTAELEWRVAYEHPDGSLRVDQGVWNSRWAAAPGKSVPWRCTELLPSDEMHSLYSPAPWFVDTTGEALAGTPLDPRLPQPKHIIHRGLALADMNADGHLDVIVSQPNRLLLGRGDGTFRDATDELGIAGEDYFLGVLAADFDRDGRKDLMFGGRRRQRSLLQMQKADGTFDQAEISVSSDRSISTSLSAHDVDGDGFLEVFIAGYGPFNENGPNQPMNATNGRDNQMLRWKPEGGFEDVTQAWGFDVEATRWCFIGAFGDADGDGDVDLYTANDFGPNVLYRRDAGETVHFTAEVEERNKIETGFSMSAWWADLDGDLDLDMYVSNMHAVDVARLGAMAGDPNESNDLKDLINTMSKGNTVMRGQEGDMVEGANSLGGRDAEWAWGTAIFDPDCDGDLDIHVLNGFISGGVDDGRDWDGFWWRHALKGMSTDSTQWPFIFSQYSKSADLGWSWAGFQRSVHFQNDGNGALTEVGALVGLDQRSDGRGVAVGDIDGDGDPDLVGTSITLPYLYVLRNDTPKMGHWIWLEFLPSGHRSVAGTRVWLTAGGRTQRVDLALGKGFTSQHDLAQHFGLGQAELVEKVEILWPDGAREVLEGLAVDSRFKVFQGEAGAPSRLEEVPLGKQNAGATARLPEIEWDNDRHRILPIHSMQPDFRDLELRDAAGELMELRASRSGAGPPVRALLMFDPKDPNCAEQGAAMAELQKRAPGGLALSGMVFGDTPQAELQAVCSEWGLDLPMARLSAEQQATVREALRPWTGERGLHLPAVMVLNARGEGRTLSQGKIRVGDYELYLGQ